MTTFEIEKHELDYMKEVHCEACKAMPTMDYTDCYTNCDGFKEELKRVREEGEI